MGHKRIIPSAEIILLMESITNQYAFGKALVEALKPIVDQAMIANALIEENALLKVENEKLKLYRD
jgi:regulator of replication initiation timing